MDLNVMMREQALAGLQSQLDAAVTEGDTVKARAVTEKIAQLQVATAPKGAPYGDTEIKAALSAKADWLGVDPKKSSRVLELGKHMDIKKFATAELFADALIKAVDAEFPAPRVKPKDDEEDPDDDPEDDGEDEDDGDDDKPVVKKPVVRRAATSPNEDGTHIRPRGISNTPWSKLSEAPRDVQKEVTRQADKFAPKTKEGREGFIVKALATHHRIAMQKKAQAKK